MHLVFHGFNITASLFLHFGGPGRRIVVTWSYTYTGRLANLSACKVMLRHAEKFQYLKLTTVTCVDRRCVGVQHCRLHRWRKRGCCNERSSLRHYLRRARPMRWNTSRNQRHPEHVRLRVWCVHAVGSQQTRRYHWKSDVQHIPAYRSIWHLFSNCFLA